jgi:hypothetical protein
LSFHTKRLFTPTSHQHPSHEIHSFTFFSRQAEWEGWMAVLPFMQGVKTWLELPGIIFLKSPSFHALPFMTQMKKIIYSPYTY